MSDWIKFKDEKPTEKGLYWIFRKKEPGMKRIILVSFDPEKGGYDYGFFSYSNIPFRSWMHWKQITEPKPPW